MKWQHRVGDVVVASYGPTLADFGDGWEGTVIQRREKEGLPLYVVHWQKNADGDELPENYICHVWEDELRDPS